jgi:hypothetical protein
MINPALSRRITDEHARLRQDSVAAPVLGLPMPAASLVHDRLIGIVARGWAGLD